MNIACLEAMLEASAVYHVTASHFDAPRPDRGTVSARGFLHKLLTPEAGPIPAGDVAVVVAHPDDEAVGLGGQLARLRDVTVVTVTDGAPDNLAFARRRGLLSRQAYADVRERELREALSLSGVSHRRQIRLAIRDQRAAYQVPRIVARLVALFRESRIALVFTHPYEGGHPDHDATAMAVHMACRILADEGRRAPAIIEMASYFAGPDGGVHQRFVPHPDIGHVTCRLTPAQRRIKRRMLDAHASQAANLSVFTCDIERFRPAPVYDFSSLPNDGTLHYESFDSGMTGEVWLELAPRALAAGELLPVA